ncbi:TlpA family protein disulfide reductase [Agromyces seonyuensis]|uniref:Redoxin family protein n=1 Tax=Agromyces seonyuensis TaxID=2662446 RepID=A0A6I4P203_9MICO|nr:TlpA disulfide reductase family protein [Agromyces seonyuensis]MWB98069.1 redoxin family protein [Agromyces seonyuensis]
MRRRIRTALAAAAALALAAGLSACSGEDTLADQYREGSNKGYIAGDGTYVEIAPEDRGDPVVFDGGTVDGSTYDSTAHDGEVLVVNFWYAACAPCRAEAPILADLDERLGDGASIVGINIRDAAGQANAFDEQFGIGYPSILDVDSGMAQLAFAGDVPPNAVPTTIVLDREHRVAARLLGQISDASIIDSMVDTVLEED